ncbi:hypothetical protein N0V90_007181 [Kalmusia sp. IMI 367209]|nr:hypothetical protein N0V90_007181 [Kalmusia sp. IMI 367209]
MALTSGWLPRPIASPLMLLTFWILSVALVNAQSPAKNAGPDPVKSFSVIKHDVLYIDSGIEKFNVSGDLYLGTSRSHVSFRTPAFAQRTLDNHILSISLTETWDWKIPANETGGLNITIKRKNVTNPNTGTPVPNFIRGHLFHGPENTTEIYNFGGAAYMYNQSFEGWIPPDSSTYPLWTYDPTADDPWDQHSIGQPWLPNHGAATEDIEKGIGFYLGGQIDMGTSTKTLDKPLKDNTQNLYIALDGMLIIDLADSTSTNISTSTMKRNTPRVGGTLDYIDTVGGSGILVALGGQIQTDVPVGEVTNRTKGELIDFNTVDVFDLESYYNDPSSNGTWYEQATTGDVPLPRIDFCTVSVAAPDNSSQHIYLYGGVDPVNRKNYDDVVILSIPSFTWTNVWPLGESPRFGHNCHRAGKRQMATIGGNDTKSKCDWELKGVAFLDLTTIEWGSVFNGKQDDFKVPKNVLGATNGTADGKATIGEPKKGWTEKGLADVFRKSRYPLPSTWMITTDTSETKTNVGAIAGGVVGGVAALALIAGGIFLWHRRRVKARSPNELHGDDVPRPGSGTSEKSKHELQGINDNDPAELPGPEAVELNAPREFVEADHDTATRAAELPGTNVAAGGVHGVPIVRTPGDDLPESPEYTPGLKRPASVKGSRRRRRSSEAAREAQQSASETQQQKESKEDYFSTSAEEASQSAEATKSEEQFQTPLKQTPTQPPEETSTKHLPGTAL